MNTADDNCTASPTLDVVGPMIHVTCPGCSLDYWVERT